MEMDSPKSSKSATTTSELVPAQDSPVFNFISNLSPIQHVKAQPVTQGFPGLNSPPLVFTSPQLNPHRQPTFFKRAQCSGQLAAKLSGLDDGCKDSAVVNASKRLVIQLSTRLTSCSEKASYSNSPVNDQIESPTECPDQFLTDGVNMDSVDADISADSTIDKSEHTDQPPDAITGSKECVAKLEHEPDTRISEETPPITRQIEVIDKEDTSIDVSAQGDGVSVDHCPEIDQEDSITENLDTGLASPLDQPVQIDKEDGNFGEITGAVLTESVVKKVGNDSEVLQHRGIRRRCLQFEDTQGKAISNQPVKIPSDSGGPTSLSLETPSTPINGNHTDTIQPMLYPRNMNSSMKIPKPSGIGLHLNSIVNSVQTGSGAVVNVKTTQRGSFSIRGKKSVPVISSHPSDNSNTPSILPLAESVSASPDDNRHETHASMAANSATSVSTYIIKPSYSSVILNPVEDQSTPGNKRKCNTEYDGGLEEVQSSPKKKRKKSSDSNEDDGCKRCNCKKSKCLKLYCDCFAAGIYCAGTCSCQGCYNRPEYEDKVLETRQLIESRNPLAFAPKIVQQTAEARASSFREDRTYVTPSSARHKRGCNCKKSMCLKKYCECYQSNVGCSEGCRCEGCKNVFGKKGEYVLIKDVVLHGDDTHEQTDGSFVEKMVVASESGVYHSENCNPHNLTPLTPAPQFVNHGNDASTPWFDSGKYFQSPESGPTFAPYMTSPRNSDNNAIISETANEILDRASFDQELDYYDNAETGINYTIPNPHEWDGNSKTQYLSGNKQYSQVGSLRWHGSSNTPMAQSSGANQLVEFDSEVSNTMQDDTPDILMDNPTPLNAVKVSSPNKKRVSPPHGRPFSSSSSVGIRTGRKFILKAVPSFPPLTPCIDSKNVVLEQTNDPQNKK